MKGRKRMAKGHEEHLAVLEMMCYLYCGYGCMIAHTSENSSNCMLIMCEFHYMKTTEEQS